VGVKPKEALDILERVRSHIGVASETLKEVVTPYPPFKEEKPEVAVKIEDEVNKLYGVLLECERAVDSIKEKIKEALE
jgi:hypothetical protein